MPSALYLPPGAVDAGVVDQHVEAGEPFAALPGEFADGALVGSVQAHDRALLRARAPGDLGGGLLAALEVAAGQHHLRAARRQLKGDLPAEARGGAGNDHSLAGHGIVRGLLAVHVVFLLGPESPPRGASSYI